MDRSVARKALRGLASRYGARRAAPLMDEEKRRRLGITIHVEPDADERGGPSDMDDDDKPKMPTGGDPDLEVYGEATDEDPELPGRRRRGR